MGLFLKIISPFFYIAVALLPVYLWSSGGLQISHYLLAGYCFSYILFNGFGFSAPDKVLFFLWAFAFVRESFSVVMGAEIRALLPVAHIFFSFVVFNAMRRAFVSAISVRFFIFCLCLAGALAVAGVLAMGYSLKVDDEGGRAVGTFNNPNQLGYFSVCFFAFIFYFRLIGYLSTFWLLLFLPVAFFLAIASLSKAAMIAIGAAAIFGGFSLSRNKFAILFGSIVLASLVILAFSLYASGYFDGYTFIRRLEGIGSSNDDNLEGRGYYLILTAGVLELFFGFGLLSVIKNVGHEVHSTIFSFVSNYGLIGGSAFLVFLFMWMRRVYAATGLNGLVLVVMPVMLYGITHNGSRFSIFWLLLGFSFATLPEVVRNAAVARDRGAA